MLIICVVLLIAALCNATWQGIQLLRVTGIIPRLDLTLARSLILTGIPFLIYGVLGVIYYRLDTVLLSLLTNANVVGWYGASYRLFDTLVFLPSIVISMIMYPVF